MTGKRTNAAGLMMLCWLAFYLFAVFFARKWADFLLIAGCAVPMLAMPPSVRGATFGSRDCNTVKYTKKEYALWFAVCICGSALISASLFLAGEAIFGARESTVTAGRSDFFYLLVFTCMVPAFFEEYLLRGGVLGALGDRGANSVWLCALLFALMHIQPQKMVYAFFAGLMITALVYLTECIYLGMLLHFCNNFCALLLSFLPSRTAEYIALAIFLCAFAAAFLLLRGKKLFADAVTFLRGADKNGFFGLFSMPIWIFIAFCVYLCLLSVG